MFYFQAEFWAETLILLKNIQIETWWYCTDVNLHDRQTLLIYEKCHFQELFPFVKVKPTKPCIQILECVTCTAYF